MRAGSSFGDHPHGCSASPSGPIGHMGPPRSIGSRGAPWVRRCQGPVESQRPMQQAVRDVLIAFMAATAQAQAEALVSSMPNRVVIVLVSSIFGLPSENPQGKHSNTLTSSAHGWPTVRAKVIGRPQTTQVTVRVGSLRSVIRGPLQLRSCRGKIYASSPAGRDRLGATGHVVVVTFEVSGPRLGTS
jgi:hypothetical protein